MPSPGMDQDNRLMEEIVGDHREVESMFHQLETGVPEPDERRLLVDKVIIELMKHSAAEEQLLYPAARRTLPDGQEIAEREIAEHGEAELVMKSLDGMDPTAPEFEPMLRQLMAAVREHVQDEERNLLPRLSLAAGREETERMGKMLAMAKKTAPTHPHPDAPDRPPGNLMNSVTGIVDHMRDALSGRGR